MKTTLFRNTFAAIAALFISMFALPQQAQAEDYNLAIAGTQVTSANCNDLSVIPGVSGTVKYDPTTKTLTLDNATIITTGEYINGIYGRIDGLTVEVKGTVNVTAQVAALVFKMRTTITGSGTLNATSSENPGIYDSNDLTIDGCTVNAKGEYGISGWGREYLTIRNATVTAEGRAGSICYIYTLTLIGCAITQPAGAAFDPSLKGVVLDGALVTEKVTIEPSMTTYNLKVADTQVTSANCNDLSVIDGVSGTAKYDPATNTLTLDNATINSTDNGIDSNIDGLTVEVKGTVNVTAQTNALWFNKPATITGGGTLNATGSTDCGIYAYKTQLTIAGCTVNAKGGWGIAGRDGSVESLTLRYATVTAEGTKGSICDFKTLTLANCEITGPTGAAFDAALRGIALNGQLVKEKVTISPTMSDFVVIDGVKKPIFSYKFFDEGDNDFALRFHLSADGKELVQIEGNRNLHTGKDIDLTKRESKHEGQLYWVVGYVTDFINVHNCHRVFIGEGGPADSPAPVFTTGTLRIDGDPAGTFTVRLKNGSIPANTNYGDGKPHTIELRYSNDPTGIDAVTADVPAKKQGTYNLQGVKLNTAFDRLPAGIYIVDGKKVVKR